MRNTLGKSKWMLKNLAALGILTVILLASALALSADQKKKKNDEAPATPPKVIDYSFIVWPNPPAIARIRYVNWYAADKQKRTTSGKVQKKSKWMDRLAGTQTAEEVFSQPFQLIQPHGMAVDSKGNLYVADAKVGAIFIFNTDNKNVELIKNGVHAHFARIVGLAIDDSDRLFVADPALSHVLVFDKDHKATDVITDVMKSPSSLAIDNQNRLLYVSDVELDQVLVFDADTYKLIRRIGTTGKKHELTTPGDFSKPTGVAVDKEGNLYVADTMNDRIEVFDADGSFITTYGKNGDGPGYFSRPKGVAIDSDGHIWVADGMQDRVQVFNKDWQLLIAFGGHGLMPGQFQSLENIYIDKRDRVFTTEIYAGRAQEFQYITDAEADKERQKREAERAQKMASEQKPAENPASNAAPAQATAKPN